LIGFDGNPCAAAEAASTAAARKVARRFMSCLLVDL
jgi:hypothetical protein